MADWHDNLAALRASMGPDTPDEEPQAQASDENKQTAMLDIVFERKGRAGKCATIITGFTVSDDEIEQTAAYLKKALGTGGSCRGGEILIQGDRRNDILRLLKARGLKARII